MEGNCVFCDKSQFEERLIGETEHSWIIATLGQITDGGYTLLVPKKHVSCMGEAGFDFNEIFAQTMFAVALEFVNLKGLPAVFEHGIVGQTIKHAHLHFVPKACRLNKRIQKDFPDSIIESVDSPSDLQHLYSSKKKPYLFYSSSELDEFRVCWNPPAPPQYLRIVIAEALHRPERANWRNMDPELDKRLGSETVRRLKPYFS